MKAEFIQRVMQIMNELGWDDTDSDAFVGSDTTKVMGHIEYVFVDAWRKAVNLLPKTYFTIKDFSDNEHEYNVTTGIGNIVLPDDFYLLYSFKVKGWQKAAEILYDSSDPITLVQANEYTRGNICRPVCVKSIRRVKRRENDEYVYPLKTILEYYSIPKGLSHKIEQALYIPLMQPLSDNTVLDERIIIPLAYICASMVFSIFEKPDISKVLENEAVQISKIII